MIAINCISYWQGFVQKLQLGFVQKSKGDIFGPTA